MSRGRREEPRVARVLSTLFWVWMTLSSAAMFPFAFVIWLVTVLFDRRLVVLHRFTCFWASLYSWTNPAWPVRIEGRERIRRGAFVLVANHQSLLDILVLFRLFVHFKFISKIENFRVPFIGWNMSLNRYIKLRRGDKGSARAMIRDCEAAIDEGSSILMFPEGTRSHDGRLGRFKHGAFSIAQRTRAPIVPIIVEGTAEALPKKGYVLRGKHQIRIRVLEPLEPTTWTHGPPEVLAAQVRAVFLEAMGQEESLVADSRGSTAPSPTRVTKSRDVATSS
jgi:1-acyl-sn-glycerol-3-phosphate acyltransferase